MTENELIDMTGRVDAALRKFFEKELGQEAIIETGGAVGVMLNDKIFSMDELNLYIISGLTGMSLESLVGEPIKF